MTNPLKSHPTFCPHLWQHFSTDPNGLVKFCCEAAHMNDNELDLSTYTIKEIFNSNAYNTIRRNNLRRIKNRECASCWNKEAKGLKSKRQLDIDAIDDPAVANNMERWSNGEDIVPIYYNLQVSKTCNQACIMCEPFYSSLIESIYNRTDPAVAEKFNFDRWNRNNVPFKNIAKVPKFWEGLSEVDSQLTQLYVTGGEPFIIKELWTYIESLVTRGYAKNINFWCNTNFSKITSAQLDLLLEFRSVELNLSIDAYGDTLEYLRHASNWKTINQNIDLAMPYIKENFKITIVPVMHALSIIELDQLIIWWNDKMKGKACKINPIILTSPFSMTLDSLPSKYLVGLKEKINAVLDESSAEHFLNVFQSIDNHCFNLENNKQLRSELEFFKHVMKKDFPNKFDYIYDI